MPLIRVAFQHGNFTAAGTTLAAGALVAYAISIPAWGVHQIFARGMYAHRQMWVPVIAGTVWTVIGVPLYVTLFNEYGVTGVAMASSIAITGYALTLAVLWIRRHSVEGLRGIVGTTVRTGTGAVLAGFAGRLTVDAITGGNVPAFGTGIGAVAAGIGVVAVVYFGVTWLAGSEDARRLVRSN